MHGIIKIELGGQERVLRFNNFSREVIANMILKSEDGFSAKPDPSEYLKRISELNQKSNLLLLKVLIYGGIVGNDYVTSFNESVTIEEVGEWVADAPEDKLLDVWTAFLESEGFGLKSDPQEEEDTPTVAKKKKTRPMKAS